MGGAKVGGQQKQTVFSTKFLQAVEKFPRMAAQVDQHADAVLPGNFGGKLLPRRVLAAFLVDEQPPLHQHTAHLVVQRRTVRQNFGRGPVRPRQRTEVRLGGGGKYHAAAVFAAQRIDRLHGRGGKVGGQALRLIKQHHAVGNAVQLAAVGGAVGKQAFKEFYRGRQHQRRVPAGGQLPRLVGQVFLAVVNQQVGQNLLIRLLALLGQCQKRQHNDDAPQPVCPAVAQCKVQHRQRFAHAGGGCQRKQPAGGLPRVAALRKHTVADGVQRRVGGGTGPQRGAVVIQRLQRGVGIQRCAACLLQVQRVIIGGRGAVIGIHQAGKQHPRVQHILHTVLAVPRWQGGDAQVRKIRRKRLPCAGIFGHSPQGGRLAAGAAICCIVPIQGKQHILLPALTHQCIQPHQAVVMPLYRLQYGGVIGQFIRLVGQVARYVQHHRAGRRVVYVLHRARQHLLKPRTVLAEIVPLPRQPCLLRAADFLPESLGQGGHPFQMLLVGHLAVQAIGLCVKCLHTQPPFLLLSL